MKIGDLVAWRSTIPALIRQTGIIVGGPHKGTSVARLAASYTVAWFDPEMAQETMRHLDLYLEVLSENQ